MQYNTEHLPEYLQQTFTRLLQVRKEIREMSIDLLMEGELKTYSCAPLGESYPFNYDIEIQGSLDPDVQSLGGLLTRIDEAIVAFRGRHTIE